MLDKRIAITLISATFLASGCSFSTDALWPSLSSSTPQVSKPPVQKIVIKRSQSESIKQPLINPVLSASPPKLGETNFKVKAPRSGKSTGTFVGNKIANLRDDLRRLQSSIDKENSDLQELRSKSNVNSKGYHERVAAMRSRLQLGTTPGNPILVEEWNGAQAQLERVNADIGAMNSLSNRVAADAAMSTYLLDATRAAFGLSGAIDDDHKQLAVLEDDVNQTVVLIERLLNELSDDIRRQSNYVANERNELNTLALAIKNGEFFGPSLATTAYSMGTGKTVDGKPIATTSNRGRPLVIIRFDRPNVNYEQALYTAVNRVLQRRPNASFDLVAVSSIVGGTAKSALNSNETRRNAQNVLRSLVDMGLPPSRVSLSATSSKNGSSNEVHLYLR
jgi:hypothetical protein